MNSEMAPLGYSLFRLAVLDKIKSKLGLNKIEKMFYVAAPLKKDTSVFFKSLNLPVVSIFGLT